MASTDDNDGVLDSAVDELYRIEHRSGWSRVQAIADVFERFRTPDDRGDYGFSLRRIAGHPRCPLSKSQLRDALEANRVFQSEPMVRVSAFITPSHAAAVSSLDPPLRSQVLRSAEEERVSVRDLVERVRELRRRRGDKRGRPPTSPAEKAVTRLDNAVLCLDEARSLLEEGAPGRESLATLQHLLAKVRECEAAITQLLRSDERFVPTLASGRSAVRSDEGVRRSA